MIQFKRAIASLPIVILTINNVLDLIYNENLYHLFGVFKDTLGTIS